MKPLINVLDKLAALFGHVAPKLLVFLAIFLPFLVLAFLARRLIQAAIGRLSTQGHVDYIVGQLGYIIILTLGTIIAFSASDLVPVATLVTSLGLAGVAVGIAVKDILGNFLAGILILVQRPFTIGDHISLAGVDGRVEGIRVRDTLVKTADSTLVYIPNNIVFNSVVTNKSSFCEEPVDFRFSCARNTDIGAALQTCQGVMEKSPPILRKPKPRAYLDDLTETETVLRLQFWIDARKSSAPAVKSQLLQEIDQSFKKKGLVILKVGEGS